MSQEKLRKIQHDARWLLQHQSITLWDLACFMDKTTASSKAVWQAPLHYRGIQALMNSVLPEAEDNTVLTSRFNIRLPVSGSTTRPTLVGIHRTDYTITSPLLPRVPNMTITSDASNTRHAFFLNLLAGIIQHHQASQQLLKLPMKKHPVMKEGVRKLLLTMKMRIRRFLTMDCTGDS